MIELKSKVIKKWNISDKSSNYFDYSGYQNLDRSKHYVRYRFVRSRFFRIYKYSDFFYFLTSIFFFNDFFRKYIQFWFCHFSLFPNFFFLKKIHLKDMDFFNNKKNLACVNQFFLSKQRLKKWQFKHKNFKPIFENITGANYFFIPVLEKSLDLNELDIQQYNTCFKTSAVFKNKLVWYPLITQSQQNFFFLEIFWFLFLNNITNYYTLFFLLV